MCFALIPKVQSDEAPSACVGKGEAHLTDFPKRKGTCPTDTRSGARDSWVTKIQLHPSRPPQICASVVGSRCVSFIIW